jgi:hypothetical protein
MRCRRLDKCPHGDSNSPPETLGKRENAGNAVQNPVQISADSDARLALILQAWRTLPEATKAAILAMIDSARKGG